MKNCLTAYLFALMLCSLSGYAQITIYDAKGALIPEGNYTNIEGTPYLHSEWLKGMLTLANEKSYNHMRMKYDEVKDKVYVEGANHEMIALVDKVKDFNLEFPVDGTVVNRHFKNGYLNIPGTAADAYFEVLAEGKTSLLKRSSKIIQENKEFNSATITKFFTESIRYYLYTGGRGIQVKKDKKALLAALGNKQTELEAYIKDQKLNLKTDADVVKLIVYYNTL
jgi:hypothetical protein